MRKLIFVFFIVCSISLQAATEDSFEITAAKPYTITMDDWEDDWEWIAVIENIYENPNGETYKGEILDGQQILLDIPSLSSDEWTDLFTFEFVSNYLVKATISFRLSPLINVEDESGIIPIKFNIDKTPDLIAPAGFTRPSLNEGGAADGVSSLIYGFEPSWEMINVSQSTPITANSVWGYYRGFVTVKAQLVSDSVDIDGKKWAMPIQAIFKVEGD